MKQGLDACISQVKEFLPDDLRHRTGLVGLNTAISQAHYPDSPVDWSSARRRLAFDELFLMQLAVVQRKRSWQQEGHGIPLEIDRALLDAFFDSLPFTLTGAQTRAVDELLQDMKSDRAMSHLLQGDVGSGKTVVAVASMLMAALNGYQSALMVPTEILAEQHFMTISHLLAGPPESMEEDKLVTVRVDALLRSITIGLLVGSLSRRAKKDMHQRIAEGGIDIIIGTQALIQGEVEIPKLALVVVDEQHRFGVTQRGSLREKGNGPTCWLCLRPRYLARWR